MGKPFNNTQGTLFGIDVTDPLLEKPQNIDEYRFCAKTLKSMMELLVERYGTNRLQAVIPENMNGPIKLSFEEYGFEIDMFCDEVTREDGVCLVLEEEKDTFFLIINGCKINPFPETIKRAIVIFHIWRREVFKMESGKEGAV